MIERLEEVMVAVRGAYERVLGVAGAPVTGAG